MPEIRPFARHDRDQLCDLVNAHIKAVVPGCSVPVATLLSQMERDPGEYIVDPWVIERETLVAIEADRLVAAVHLHRYGGDAAVGPALRNAASINWIVCWPADIDAGRHLMCDAVERAERWKPRVTILDMSLPAPLWSTNCSVAVSEASIAVPLTSPSPWPAFARKSPRGGPIR